MDLEARLLVLEELYRIFDAFINTHQTACAEGCEACCTAGVTLTSLEAMRLIRHLGAGGDRTWEAALDGMPPAARFRPRVTVNRLAALCAQDLPIPEEPAPLDPGRCPFLSETRCPVYADRPFACRCMVSRRTCSRRGDADMAPLVVTVSNVFMQTIEHVDVPGCTGNLVDVLRVLSGEENRRRYAAGTLDCGRHGLLANEPLSILMVPPEHREQVQPLLKRIHGIRVPPRGL